MNKKQRKQIWDKSGGKCWYCGCDLPEKGWHADHINPIRRNGDGTYLNPENDTIENMVPSCGSCNRMKGSMPLEYFRQTIGGFISSLNEYHTQYKFAKRYGLVEETRKPVIFWFEKNNKNEKN